MSSHLQAVVSAAILAVPVTISAQGIIIPGRCAGTLGGPPVPCQTSAVVRTRSDVHVALVGRVLRYEIDERFVNRGAGLGEADYVFPLPKDAAFQDLKLSINGDLTAGETMNAGEARRIYEEIVRRQRDPALVEWMGYGLLRARIFPIAPGEEKRVVVRFQSVVDREGDAWRVDYQRGTRDPSAPLRAGAGRGWPQPVPGRTDGPQPQTSSGTFTLDYQTSPFLGTPYSPTHELSFSNDGGHRRVEARGDGSTVTILIPVRRTNSAAISVLANAPGGEDAFALLTVTPPVESRRTVTPRDITFVLDVSGSMSGRKIEQARAAGRQLLQTLRPSDRFRMIDFSSDVRSFRDSWVYATNDNVRAATHYLDALEANGGTNIAGALEEALRAGGGRREAAGERLGVVLLLTDGEPTVGERDPNTIAATAARQRGDARIFAFGLGADVNAGLLEQLALQGGGTAQFVRPEEDVERLVGITASRLVDPVLTNVRIRSEGDVRLSKTLPQQPLDLFAGQDLVVVGRYSGHGDARIVVEGRRGGENVTWTSTASFPERERDNPFVPRLWATQRIGWLSAEKRMHPSTNTKEIDDEIRSLGERFGIPTEFTSYLVQEPCSARPAGCVAAMHPGMLQSVVATGAAAAPAARNEVAFDAAKQASAMRAAVSTRAVDSIASLYALSGGTSVRSVGGHTFVLRDGRWTDAKWRAGVRVVKVQMYSPAYFELLQRLPDLRAPLALGDRVLVMGRAVAIETVSAAGEITKSEMDRLVQDW